MALITGWGDQLDSRKMQENGVDTVVAKPFQLEDIRRLLTNTLS